MSNNLPVNSIQSIHKIAALTATYPKKITAAVIITKMFKKTGQAPSVGFGRITGIYVATFKYSPVKILIASQCPVNLAAQSSFISEVVESYGINVFAITKLSEIISSKYIISKGTVKL